MKFWKILLVSPFFTLLMVKGSYATDIHLNTIELHGFISQGYLKSSKNDYFKGSKNGSWEFNELGISINVPLSEDLRFGTQFFSRDLGEYTNNELSIDWAFLDYSIQNWFSLRAGKIKTPFGLYNKLRDVDPVRSSIFVPQAVYFEAIRDIVVAFHGIEFYGNLNLGGVGYLDYELFTGFDPVMGFILMNSPAIAVVTWSFPRIALFLLEMFQSFKTAETWVGVFLIEQLSDILPVKFQSF